MIYEAIAVRAEHVGQAPKSGRPWCVAFYERDLLFAVMEPRFTRLGAELAAQSANDAMETAARNYALAVAVKVRP